MNDTSVFDPLLGRLRSMDTIKVNTTKHIHHGAPAGGVSVQTGITVPSGGTEGDIFYDTDDAVLYIYANGMWNPISGGVVAVTARLSQSGDYRVDQASNYLISQDQ